MTHRTRELFDFAQTEPLAIEDMVMLVSGMDEEEIGYIEQAASNILSAIRRMECRRSDELVWPGGFEEGEDELS